MEGSPKITRLRSRNSSADKKFFAGDLRRKQADRKVSETFMKQGENRLLHGDIEGLQFFDLAARMDPCNSELYYRQGLALLEYSEERGEEKGFLLACKKFKTATALQGDRFDAWHAWGDTLFRLGEETGEHHYYIEAEKKLAEATALGSDAPEDILADLYWVYGLTWAMLGHKSEEAGDLHLAMEAFGKASGHLDDLPPEFWLDYGEVALDLFRRVSDTALIGKAINCYKNAVSISISSYESWSSLASAMHLLYASTHEEDHFSQANECFTTAAQLRGSDVQLWLGWAEMLILSGKLTGDVKRLHSAIEKCQKALGCDAEDPCIIAVWVEALSLLGSLTEEVHLIQEAQEKICAILDEADGYTEVWYAYGICLQALATYFNDLDYYYQAIEKYQEGLSIDRTAHRLWHGLATCYTTAACMELDPAVFDRAHKFYQKALSIEVNTIYLYDYAVSLSRCGDYHRNRKHLELSIYYFEQVLARQKDVLYLHPDWLFEYANALDLLGEYAEEDRPYIKAIEVLSHVLMVDPEFPGIHHKLGNTYTHYGDFSGNTDAFRRALHHFRLANQHDEENERVLLDWALALTSLAQHLGEGLESDQYYREAEYKMTQAARLGSTHAYYQLGCLYSIIGQYERAFRFVKKAHEMGALPPVHELLEDEWLEGLRTTEAFRTFLSTLAATPDN